MNGMWKLHVTLAGGKVFVGPDIRCEVPGWSREEFKEPILKVGFPFVARIDGVGKPVRLDLTGFEQYNFFIEARQDLVTGFARIEAIWFLGKIPGKAEIARMIIGQNGYRQDVCTWGREYAGVPSAGWKRGFPEARPAILVREIG